MQNVYAQFEGYTPPLSIQATEIYKNSNIYQQDFLYLCEGLKEFHANVFANFPEIEFNKEKDISYRELSTCNNESVFGFIANKFTNKIKDRHTGVRINQRSDVNNKYPFRCKYLVDTLVIIAVSDQLPFSLCGERIKSINGLDVKDIERTTSEMIVTENYVSLQNFIMLRVNSTEYLKYIGVILSDTAKVQISTFSGKEFEVSPNFNGNWKSQLPSTPIITERTSESFSYKIINEDSLCYIQFNRMIDRRIGEMYLELLPWWKRWLAKTIRFFGGSAGIPDMYFEEFLNTCIADISKNNIEKVIVDLRYNTGGSATLGNLLLYAFGVDNLKGFSSERKKSVLYKMQMQAMGIDHDFDENEEVSDSLFHTASTEGADKIEKRFKGDVYFITSEWTFSSAVQLATLVKDNHLFKVIGEPVSEKPSHFGEALFLRLPNTDLVCSISCKQFHRPDKSKDNEETLYPDVVIYKTYSDIINGIDRVYEWISVQ